MDILSIMSNYGPKKNSQYNEADNARRKSNNTGEVLETVGQNKTVKAYAPTAWGSAKQQARYNEEKYIQENGIDQGRTLKDLPPDVIKDIEERYGCTPPKPEPLHLVQEKSMIDESSVGKLFTDSEGNIFELVSYCAHPTATFKKLGTEVQVGGAVNSLLLRDIKMIPEESQAIMRTLQKQLLGNRK